MESDPQGTASEATLVALLGAKAKVIKRLKEQHPEWTEYEILPKLVAYCSSKYNPPSSSAIHDGSFVQPFKPWRRMKMTL